MSDAPRLIPELDVTSLAASVGFYRAALGFKVLYERPEGRFAMLDLEARALCWRRL